MAKTFEFGEFAGSGGQRPAACVACEEMLAEAVDGALDAVGRDGMGQGWFDRHVASCEGCSAMLADAQRGAAWLELLKAPRPEPSAQLLERIMAQTTGAQTLSEGVQPLAQTSVRPEMVPAALPQVAPAAVPANLLAFPPSRLPVRRWRGAMFEPRLAMTAAMAFFSLALTLNLSGVRLDEIRLSDLSPASLKHSYYEANAKAVRYYDNLRVVRVLESRVEDLRQSNDQEQPGKAPQQQDGPKGKAPGRPEVRPETQPEKKQEGGPGVSRKADPVPARPHLQLTDEKTRRDAAGVLRAAWKTGTRDGGLV